MWELIIAYMVGDNVERFTRRSTADFGWDNEGDAYDFTGNDGLWNGVFHNVLWFTETKIGEVKDDGSRGERGYDESHIALAQQANDGIKDGY